MRQPVILHSISRRLGEIEQSQRINQRDDGEDGRR